MRTVTKQQAPLPRNKASHPRGGMGKRREQDKDLLAHRLPGSNLGKKADEKADLSHTSVDLLCVLCERMRGAVGGRSLGDAVAGQTGERGDFWKFRGFHYHCCEA